MSQFGAEIIRGLATSARAREWVAVPAWYRHDEQDDRTAYLSAQRTTAAASAAAAPQTCPENG
jgi:hypothetical protein